LECQTANGLHGTSCQVTSTRSLGVCAEASEVEEALEEDLPGVGDVTVTRLVECGVRRWNGTMMEAIHRRCRYEVEFHDVVSWPAGSSAVDEAPWSWQPNNNKRYTEQEQYDEGTGRAPKEEFPQVLASSNRGEHRVVGGGDLPLMSVNRDSLFGPGAVTRVREVRKGLSYRAGGTVALEVTQNGQDYSSSGVTYTYLPVAEVQSLEPAHGPVQGGTEVLVRGLGFVNSARLTCRFGASNQGPDTADGVGNHARPRGRSSGADVSAARFFNSTCIICVAPPALRPGQAYLEVSNNGDTSSANFSTTRAVFTYVPPVKLVRLDPALGPTSGNVSVTITGGPFPAPGSFGDVDGGRDQNDLRCRFGDVTVVATWISPGELHCYAPPHRAGQYPVEVTTNDQDYTSQRLPFFFYQDPALSRILPVSGPAQTAGTRVTVYGDGFVNSSLLQCRFGADVVPAEYISDHEITCDTPPLDEEPISPYADAEKHPGTGDGSGAMTWTALSEQYTRYPDPMHRSRKLFPEAHHYPLYLSQLVAVEVSNNAQDWTDSGITFLYQADATVKSVAPAAGLLDTAGGALWVVGNHFVNSTSLRCRIGPRVVNATFLRPELVLCFAPSQAEREPDQGSWQHARLRNPDFNHPPGVRAYVGNDPWDPLQPKPDPGIGNYRAGTGKEPAPGSIAPRTLIVEVANNGLDFTFNRKTYDVVGSCPTGSYCPGNDLTAVLPCPRGTFCPGTGNFNFTLCPRGMYQPLMGQADCLRCPVGFMCPDLGQPVPRMCPAGFVCDVTGIELADQPCPEGHFCLEGTATTATTCGHPTRSGELFPTLTHAERSNTLRKGHRVGGGGLGSLDSGGMGSGSGHELVLGARESVCWSNATDDFGLQASMFTSRFWQERHQMPLAIDSPFAPIRGRFCLDDMCMRLEDAEDMSLVDHAFDYSAFNLRRPVPCPKGTYCHVGTAVDSLNMKNFSTPQPCFESMHCPEGSADPLGSGECPAGFYCPFGHKISCPAGTHCPREGHWDPLPCRPGTFSAQVGMAKCSDCPRGYMCPGYGRLDPAICPAGFVCSRPSLTTPNLRCPPGYYCNTGTATGDPFRNDTTLRPYPCDAGSYCLGGVGSREVYKNDFFYAQPCTEGFFCEVASTSPRGNGLCPPGFYCPEGTGLPIPTPKGTFALLEGTAAPAKCSPGTYAPTIESTQCYPCPPGSECAADGSFVADICPPGSYRSTSGIDGLPCVACPQGTWSKNWELREMGECMKCPTGTRCEVDGMVHPCDKSDLPTPFEPVVNLDGSPVLAYLYPAELYPDFVETACRALNPRSVLKVSAEGGLQYVADPFRQQYFFGELVPP